MDILLCIVISQIVNRVNGIYSVGTDVVIVIGWIGQKDPSDANRVVSQTRNYYFKRRWFTSRTNKEIIPNCISETNARYRFSKLAEKEN